MAVQLLQHIVSQSQLSECENTDEVQAVLQEDPYCDILERIGFRGALHKVTLEARDRIMR